MSIEKIALERIALNNRAVFSAVQLEYFNPVADAFIDTATESLVVSLQATVLGKGPKEFTCQYPESWWQHLKERWFPGWLLRRHPVRYRQWQVKAYMHFSEIPDMEGFTKVFRIESYSRVRSDDDTSAD
jgi:hypothetical protein